ncbi:MAG: ACP S-malonyltransferase [Bernardetiaceae bacterium]
MNAYVFPGQGAQFPGMGKDLFVASASARTRFEEANDLLGFSITEIMFEGSEEALKQTRVTQPAVFLHSVILSETLPDFSPDMVAGHSLGELSALVAAGVLSFADGLRLVAARAQAMQKACEAVPSTMAAVLGMDDALVEQICADITADVVVPANYNSPGQIVISGSHEGIRLATEALKSAGAKRVLPLNVGGAFHSPLMEPARQELAAAIEATPFAPARCPVYQNATATSHTKPEDIRHNLIAQLTAPVRWTQSVRAMIADGATHFVECGPGKVLQGLIKKTDRNASVSGV